MEYFKKRDVPVDFQKPIQDIFAFLTMSGKYNLVGSSNLKSILYNSDYDLNDTFKRTGKPDTVLTEVQRIFQKKFSDAQKDPHLFITDFKCGQAGKEALRWNASDMKKGYKVVKGKRYNFKDCLLQKAMIKLDLIALINGAFTEFSEIYYIYVNDKTNNTPITSEQLQKNLIKDATEYRKEGKWFKSMKRLLAFMRFFPEKYQKQAKLMLDFFDGQVGLLNKSKNELEILGAVMEGKNKKPKVEDIYKNLQAVKQSLSNVFIIHLKDHLSNHIDKMCHLPYNSLKKEIATLENYLQKIVNEEAKGFCMHYHIQIPKK